MEKIIRGKAYVLGDDIDTDQIIPARHLVYNLDDENERKLYGKYALSGLPKEMAGLPHGNIPFVRENVYVSEYSIVIAGKNFGCGSSREHAPVALNIAGVKAVVAVSYARIFYRNSVDGGFLIPYEIDESLSQEISTDDLIEIDREHNQIKNLSTGKSYSLKPLGEVAEIVEAGGIFGYARKHNMLR